MPEKLKQFLQRWAISTLAVLVATFMLETPPALAEVTTDFDPADALRAIAGTL